MEIDGGNFKLNIKQKELHHVAEYLKPQGRFRHLSEEQLEYLQKDAQSEWNALLELEKRGRFPGY
jgi:pyruvate/2-oxoacid:ferredoxin oxidoreductase beta subunit